MTLNIVTLWAQPGRIKIRSCLSGYSYYGLSHPVDLVRCDSHDSSALRASLNKLQGITSMNVADPTGGSFMLTVHIVGYDIR